MYMMSVVMLSGTYVSYLCCAKEKKLFMYEDVKSYVLKINMLFFEEFFKKKMWFVM